jgi:predicted CoA-substrate-specific enzyme activase
LTSGNEGKFIYFAGVDIGASATKVVIVNNDLDVVGKAVQKSGVDLKGSAKTVFEKALESAQISKCDVKYIISTGYGRNNITFADETLTEISCHGKGVFHYYPHESTIIDIGGQDSKIIKLDSEGKKINFKMNRKCAAGTGTFLNEIANRLDVELGDLNELASRSEKNLELNSYCTVFASTEILTRIREGEKVEDMVKGAFNSIVKRILEMGTFSTNVILTGGVIAHNMILAELLEIELKTKIKVPPDPQFIGAFGAAISAKELYNKK